MVYLGLFKKDPSDLGQNRARILRPVVLAAVAPGSALILNGS